MMNDIKNIIPLPFLVMFLIITACSENSDQDLFNAVSSAELTSVRNDMETYDLAVKGENEDLKLKLKLKLAKSILRHVILIRNTSVEIKVLRGEPLETLCLLTEPDARKILNEAGNPQLAGLAHEYLLRIEPEVRKRIKGYQETMKGTGCYLTPV